MTQTRPSKDVGEATFAAASVYLAWTLATWILEGRIETLLRPEAAGARAIYAVIANILLGIVAGVTLLRYAVKRGILTRRDAGFGSGVPSVLGLASAIVLGISLYAVQGAPSWSPIILLNAFLQVFVVSAAEVIVCWAVVGSVVKTLFNFENRGLSVIAGALAASVLFGAYHFAHSPPFNTVPMVGLLTIVGLATNAFFFVSRDVYATIVFHNFLGVFGVVRALQTARSLDAFVTFEVAIALLAALTILALALCDWLLLRQYQ